ncbi:FAD-dependent oxidoreductase [Haloarcula salina]|uniref:FAD-dependent oxidoreductase n=1 Tax=Haloarcula salina TaxID=1429914 RepID=A0AA41KCN2_9EURY|nr:FAD-dependent oxidoreductase [Haloarcula salina]MBV0902605.1 FAD-dependent oxidoreductase [Haloarcula salina]
MSDPFVVVGGDAAGLSAASKFARERPERDVLVFEKGAWISYAHCGTPYYVKGEVERLTDLLSLSPEDAAERGIDLRRHHEVTAVDADAKAVTVEHDGETTRQSYEALLVATGAHAVTDPIPGADLDGVFTLHGLDSAAAIRAYLSDPDDDDIAAVEQVDRALVERYADRTPPERVAIVGGGYVGVEMAEAFRSRGLETHLFQRPEQVLPPFGEAVGERAADHLRDRGVHLHLDTSVERLVGDDHVTAVAHEGGTTGVDAALVGIGIRPNTDLLSETGVELGGSGAVATDDYGRTTVEDIYAAGDCAEMRHAVTGEPAWVPLGLTANRAGRAIGQTVAGDREPVGDIAGTAVVKAFELECGRTGILDHDEARAAGFDPVSETITAGSRSGYYPGGDETTVTLTADRETGRLLGGAIAGRDRAAIRIDTLATALESDLTGAELERLDLAYAPPFSPVWDPVLVAAKVLRGSLD